MNLYKQKRNEIKGKLEEFKRVNENDRRLFLELCFCLCTPQSKAVLCWDAIEKLNENGILLNANKEKIAKILKGVRFNRTKARRVVEAREKFFSGETFKLREILEKIEDDYQLRKWLVENVDGLGMKEASHFMRNIGRGDNVAILDRHILKNLQKYGILKKVPDAITKKNYLDIETKMKKFASKLGIPLAELDLVFWSKETGFIFK